MHILWISSCQVLFKFNSMFCRYFQGDRYIANHSSFAVYRIIPFYFIPISISNWYIYFFYNCLYHFNTVGIISMLLRFVIRNPNTLYSLVRKYWVAVCPGLHHIASPHCQILFPGARGRTICISNVHCKWCSLCLFPCLHLIWCKHLFQVLFI